MAAASFAEQRSLSAMNRSLGLQKNVRQSMKGCGTVVGQRNPMRSRAQEVRLPAIPLRSAAATGLP